MLFSTSLGVINRVFIAGEFPKSQRKNFSIRGGFAELRGVGDGVCVPGLATEDGLAGMRMRVNVLVPRG